MWTPAEDCTIVLGGGAGGNEVLLEICSLSLKLDSRASRREAEDLIARVCERLKELQIEFYDGAEAIERAKHGATYGLFSVLNLLRVGRVDCGTDAWGSG
jgi:hypothetical protein